MTDPLRSRFEAATRDITPPPSDLGRVQIGGLRQRRRRLVSATVVGTAVLVAVSAVAWSFTSFDRARPQPAAKEHSSFVRLLTNPRGVFEIEPADGEICYRFEMRGATSAHVHEERSDQTVLDLPANDAGFYGYLGCASGLDPGALQQIADNPQGHVIEFHNSSSGGSEVATLQHDEGEPDCLRTELTSWEYGVHFEKTEGEPGEEVHIWAPSLRGEDGHYAESGGFELWWNAGSPQEVHRLRHDSPAIQLTSIDLTGRCYFQTAFTVPDVPDGEYRITGFMFDQPASEGYGIFGQTRFTVGGASSDLPSCAHDKTYGQSIPGQWLTRLLLRHGAPGGVGMRPEDVRDTGTALQIDAPQYNKDPIIYGSMLTPENAPPGAALPAREVGSHRGYTLYLERDDTRQLEIYKAVSDEWQIALIGYPGANNDRVTWPDGILEWLREAVDVARQSPPECEGPIN